MTSYTVEVEEAVQRLDELLRTVAGGGEVIITRGGAALARLAPVRQRKAGCARGLFTVPDDFDAPLDDFRDDV